MNGIIFLMPQGQSQKSSYTCTDSKCKVHDNPGFFYDFKDILNKEASQRYLVKELGKIVLRYKSEDLGFLLR